MLRATFFILISLVAFACALVERDDTHSRFTRADMHRSHRLLNRANHHGHKGKKSRYLVKTGENTGLLNLNPGHHLLIDDVTVKKILNHLVNINVIRLEEVGKNVEILSNNHVVGV